MLKVFSLSSVQGILKTSILGYFFPIGICDIEKCQFGPVCPTLVMKTFDMCLLTPQGNALLGSQLVLAWVLRIRRSNFGPSAHRLKQTDMWLNQCRTPSNCSRRAQIKGHCYPISALYWPIKIEVHVSILFPFTNKKTKTSLQSKQ